MEDIVQYMKMADRNAIDEIFELALEMKRQVHPEWEIVYFALNRENREQEKKRLVELIEAL